MKSKPASLPLICALGTGALAGAPFLAQRFLPSFVVPIAAIAGAVFFVVGFSWRKVLFFIYGGQFVSKLRTTTLAESIDQRFWRFVIKNAYPAFVLLGVALPAKFLLEGDPLSDTTLRLSGIGLVVVVMGWFAPLFVDDI